MYLTRTLHPSVLGQVSFAETSIGYFVLLAGLGIPIYAMRKTSEYRDDRHKLSVFVKEILVIGVVCDLISMGICVGLTFGVSRFNDDRVLLWILMWQILFGTFSFEWLYKGTENFKKLALRTILVKAVSLLLVVLLVKSEEDAGAYAGVVVGTSCLTALINFTGIRGLVDWSVRVKPKSALRHFRGIIIFFLMSCAVTIYVNMDIFMLGFMTDNASVGYYGVASKIKTILTAVGGVLWGIALPKATSYWRQNNAREFILLGRRSMGYILWLQIPVSVFAFVVAEFLIEFVGGDEYLAGAVAFRCLVVSFIPIAISNIIGGQILIPSGKEKCLLVAEILGAVVNLVLNFFCIARWGIVGAAVSTVIAEVVVTAFVMWVVRFEMKASLFNVASIVRQCVSALLTGAAVWGLVRFFLADGIPFVVLVVSAVVFFALDLFWLVIFRDEFTCNEMLQTLRSCCMAAVRWSNRKRLVVWKDAGRGSVEGDVKRRDADSQAAGVVGRGSVEGDVKRRGADFDVVGCDSAEGDVKRRGADSQAAGVVGRGSVVGDVKRRGADFGLKFCPCCGSWVKAMVYNNYHWYPKIYNPKLYLPEKRRTECPNCGSFSRHRLLMWYFLEHSEELKSVNNFLYFACERQIMGWLDDNGIKYTTADLFAEADLQIDIEDTGLDENMYEYVVCNHVLEHVNDFRRALREIYRILAPNGIFICSFPILDSLETYVEANSGRESGATPSAAENCGADAGGVFGATAGGLSEAENCGADAGGVLGATPSGLSEAEKIERFGQRDHLRIFGRDSKTILESIGFTVEVYDRTRCPEYIVPEDGPAAYDKAMLFICRK